MVNNLEEIIRHRTSLVRARSASAQRLHHLADQLLPGCNRLFAYFFVSSSAAR